MCLGLKLKIAAWVVSRMNNITLLTVKTCLLFFIVNLVARKTKVLDETLEQEVGIMLRRFLPVLKRKNVPLDRPATMWDLMEAAWNRPFDFFLSEDVNFPSINLSENGKEIRIKAELPGMEAKDVDISLQNDHLIIQGEKKFEEEENKDNFHRLECSYGSFYRSIPLPAAVDATKIKAKFKNGVLKIVLPKLQDAGQKKIEIQS